MATAYPSGFDAHTHLDHEAFDGDRAAVVERARAAGVAGLAIAAGDPARWGHLEAVARAVDAPFSLGVHPWWIDGLSDGAIDDHLADLARRSPALIGETGLDHVRARDEGSRARQLRVFRAHLALARELRRPVVLHLVRAWGPALAVLEADGVPGGMVHGFVGPREVVPRLVALGLVLGVGLTATNPGARRLREALPAIPRGRLVLETDCPDWPRGGRRTEPADLVAVARAVGEATGADAESVLAITGATARDAWGRAGG